MKKSFLTVCFVLLVFGLMFSLSSCQKKQEAETGQPGVESTDTAAPAPEATPAPAPEMTPAPSTEAPAPSTDTAAPAPGATEVPAPPAAQ